jgi:hypothetical protein
MFSSMGLWRRRIHVIFVHTVYAQVYSSGITDFPDLYNPSLPSAHTIQRPDIITRALFRAFQQGKNGFSHMHIVIIFKDYTCVNLRNCTCSFLQLTTFTEYVSFKLNQTSVFEASF